MSPSTPPADEQKHKRFYIVTGKGGTGKTTTALAFVKYLNSQGKKARYLNFTTSSLSASKAETQEIQQAVKTGAPFVALNLFDCSSEYVGRKLKSKTVGKMVVRTPFFKALVSMIPGFNYLVYLGKALDMLKADDDLIFVLDSPSSGHALTMLEAAKNFGDIFQSGLLFEDTQKVIKLLYSPGFAQINILCLPTLLAASEAFELEEELSKASPISTKIFCNNSFKELEGIGEVELPDFLAKKLETEKEIEKRFGERTSAFIRHSLEPDDETIVKELVPAMGVMI